MIGRTVGASIARLVEFIHAGNLLEAGDLDIDCESSATCIGYGSNVIRHRSTDDILDDH